MTFTPRRFFGLTGALIIAAASLLLAFGARAQSTGEVDPPGRVARLSELNGQVWLYNPDTAEWVSADLNRPLTNGDRLATDPGARAELQVGSTILRLDASSELEVLQLDDDIISLQLHGGSMTARVRNLTDAGEVDVQTEEGRFALQRAGRYRIDRDRPSSLLTVYTGEAAYEGANSALTVNQGQRAEFWLDSSNAAQYSVSSPVSDDFAAWNSERDRLADRVVAPRYVSAEMTGVEELDRYGSWDQNTEYGALWVPRGVAAGWAPYSSGHWAYVRPWGWTWVDDAPWGFAPFHYGRWVYYRNNWGWAPGTRVARPVYAPALVAWVGGPRASVSVNIGGGPAVGWFPLAPREVYVPGYRVSPRYVQNINITNVTNASSITAVINNPRAPREFGNRRFPNALTVVPAAVMTERRPVAPAAAQLRNTPWVRDMAREPRRGEVVVTAPIAAPRAPVQANERRPVAPPPGTAGNVRAPRDGLPPRGGEPGRAPGQAQDGGRGADRGDRRPGQREEAGRPDPSPNRPVGAGPGAPAAPAAVGTPNAPPTNAAPTQRPANEPPLRRPGSGAGDDRRGPGREMIPAPAPAPAPAAAPSPAPAAVAPVRPAVQPQPVAPVAQPRPVAPPARPAPPREAAERPGAAAPAAEAPGRRPPAQRPQAPVEERRQAPRAESPAAAAPRPPQRPEPAAAPRPVEAPARPAAEAPRPVAPDARRPEPPQRARAESARDERREEKQGRDRADRKDN
ncbi:MAG: DUF6600 domain-containing protein [Burkholderiales bacterium]